MRKTEGRSQPRIITISRIIRRENDLNDLTLLFNPLPPPSPTAPPPSSRQGVLLIPAGGRARHLSPACCLTQAKSADVDPLLTAWSWICSFVLLRLLIVFSLLRLLFKDCFCSGLSCSLISFVFFLRQIFFWSCSFLSSACAFHYLMFLSSCFCFRVPFPFRHFLLSFVLESSCFLCVLFLLLFSKHSLWLVHVSPPYS